MITFKNALISVGSLILTTTINAQTVIQKPIICDLTTKITNELLGEKYKEKPVWAGTNKENQNIFLLLANAESGTWTLIEMKDPWSCIVGLGDRFSLDSLESILKLKK